MAVLALLAAANAQTSESPQEVSIPKSQINWRWLLACLPIALGSWVSQRTQSGEDLRLESYELMIRGAQDPAWEKAEDATRSDFLSARLNGNLARIREVLAWERQTPGQAPPFTDSIHRRIIALQPTRAFNYLDYANALIKNGNDKEAESQYEKAVQLDPNDPAIRFARAKWKLERKDENGWRDIEYIAALKDKPYGKYPATPEMVDLNFARAYAMLAERDISKNKAAAKNWIARGLEVIAEGRRWEPQRRSLEQAAEIPIDESREQTMNELETQLKELSEKLS